MNITDNVLSQKLFDDLYYNITETDFPWYLQNTGVSVEGDGSFQFTHQFCNQLGNRSPFDFLMKPMYYRLGVNKLYRCKMNLTMKTKKTYEFLPLHTDFSFTDGGKKFDYNTAIFYLNTNNGYTLFEDGTKVDSIANRMVVFNSNTLHAGCTPTDTLRRCVINFNHFI